ncbi:hypothetical protein ACWDZW_12815 [Streptomyces coeruleorubidus]|uniref:hypothetical protein n=1 Tax=Streptomyces coeruleorubidus TaxID=116188 RepID=UPI0033C07BE2
MTGKTKWTGRVSAYLVDEVRPDGDVPELVPRVPSALICIPVHGCRAGDGTLRLIVLMGAAICAALTLGGGAWLAGLL